MLVDMVRGINEPEAEKSHVNGMPHVTPPKSAPPSKQEGKIEKIQAPKAFNIQQSKAAHKKTY